MPLARYLLRNEYCLADPELYKAADKNDPEALLEGVAMAGLVGVLRQLGDLAEFAAGIFNDLHEEVMATASRGHRLRIRVQQLEAEFPSVEKAFLSQTNHSLLLYNEGIDWHPNLQVEQSLITRGDLPQSVMDTYEECRGPPRLFLLDKFDNAGLGACLKRFSDPSFFKTELTSSESTRAESQREKKARKIRRKGSQWRIRETAEGSAKSHAKLQQLFLEERKQSDINVPTSRVKLKKRQLNGFLFDSIRKSYMEKFLESRSPEQLKSSKFGEMGSEMVDDFSQTFAVQLVKRDEDPVSSYNSHEKILEICMDELSEDVIEEAKLDNMHSLTSDIESEKVPSNFYEVDDKKEDMMVVRESKTEDNADEYRSDDVTSEIDNYMDALTTMESEMETETEYRPKNELGFFHIEKKFMDSNNTELLQDVQIRFSDSHSIENSSASDEGTNSFKKGRSSFSYSDSPSSSPENVLFDGEVTAKPDPSSENIPTEVVEISSAKVCENGDAFGTRSSEHLVSNVISNEVSRFPSYKSGFGELSRESSLTDSTLTLFHTSEKESTSKFQSMGSDSNEVFSSYITDGSLRLSANSEEDGNNLSRDLPCKINVSDILSQARDDTLPLAAGKGQPEGLLDGKISSDSQLHVSNSSNSSLENKDSDDALEEMVPEEYAEDNCSMGNMVDATFDSSDTARLPTEDTLNGLAGKDLEIGSPTTIPPECLLGSNNGSSDVDDLEPGDFVGLTFPEMSNEVPPFESGSTEVGITTSEVESSYDGVELSSESPTRNQASETEVLFQLADSVNETTYEEAGEIETVVGYDGNINLQEECHSHNEDLLQEKHISCNRDLDQSRVENPNLSSSEDLIGSDVQKAARNQEKVFPLELKFMVSNQESYDPAASELLNFVHNKKLVEDQTHLHLGDCTRVGTSLGQDDQESQYRKPQTDLSGKPEDTTSRSTSHELLEPQIIMPVLDFPMPDREAVQANVMEIPPLPPLPPIEWRIGKPQQCPLALEREMVQSSLNPFSPVIEDVKPQRYFSELDAKFEQSLNPFLAMNNEDGELLDDSVMGRETALPSLNPILSSVIVAEVDKINQDILASEKDILQPLNPFLSLATEDEKSPNCSLDSVANLVHPDSNEFSSSPSNKDENAQHSSLNLDSEVLLTLNLSSPMSRDTNEFVPLPSNEDVTAEHSSIRSEDKVVPPLTSSSPLLQDREDKKPQDITLTSEENKFQISQIYEPPPIMQDEKPSTVQNEKHQDVSLSLERELIWHPDFFLIPPMEEEKPNGSRKAWLHRPRDPLIQAVASHDKSTLRKVTERALPQSEPKMDERDSLLQQIRAKSFNLKPTVLTRPNIQAPKSNLRVSAILEKANAIRQALAGSDEDDDSESWSDS